MAEGQRRAKRIVQSDSAVGFSGARRAIMSGLFSKGWRKKSRRRREKNGVDKRRKKGKRRKWRRVRRWKRMSFKKRKQDENEEQEEAKEKEDEEEEEKEIEKGKNKE